jgi:hypothetical protein
MSASGISDANLVQPASWTPAPQQGATPPAPPSKSSDAPASASAPHKPAHHHHHKVDVKA